ncbi:hypothetical protein SKAU_G00358610 [Synaphobranchus kaupii]|uniref:Uncharacterized protein n=1 Tax=Synaphobranchus kaupii TaxID=118154 RepID=A0A9Q1IFW0_SYNKA|nr:hypothetical protein SKAU_G00358610 [Synaphobranchus kaupii]
MQWRAGRKTLASLPLLSEGFMKSGVMSPLPSWQPDQLNGKVGNSHGKEQISAFTTLPQTSCRHPQTPVSGRTEVDHTRKIQEMEILKTALFVLLIVTAVTSKPAGWRRQPFKQLRGRSSESSDSSDSSASSSSASDSSEEAGTTTTTPQPTTEGTTASSIIAETTTQSVTSGAITKCVTVDVSTPHSTPSH